MIASSFIAFIFIMLVATTREGEKTNGINVGNKRQSTKKNLKFAIRAFRVKQIRIEKGGNERDGRLGSIEDHIG